MRRLAPVAFALLLSACSTFGSPPVARTYRLTYPAPANSYAPAHPRAAIVRVAPFSVSPVYDRLGFIYRAGAYDVGVDNYNRWITAPGAMITELIARDLASAGVAKAVLDGPSALTPDFEVGGRIEEFDEVDTDGCQANVRLRVLISHVGAGGPRMPLSEEVFASEQPCEPGDPTSFAAAMSRAVQAVSEQVTARVAQVTEPAVR